MKTLALRNPGLGKPAINLAIVGLGGHKPRSINVAAAVESLSRGGYEVIITHYRPISADLLHQSISEGALEKPLTLSFTASGTDDLVLAPVSAIRKLQLPKDVHLIGDPVYTSDVPEAERKMPSRNLSRAFKALGGRTEVVLIKGNRMAVGVTECSRKDAFNYHLGVSVALKRATAKLKANELELIPAQVQLQLAERKQRRIQSQRKYLINLATTVIDAKALGKEGSAIVASRRLQELDSKLYAEIQAGNVTLANLDQAVPVTAK